MTALQLLTHLRRCDIKLWVEDGQLSYDAPDGALTPDLLEQVLERKADLVELLRDSEASGQSSPLVPISREEPQLLSFAQQRLWFLDQFEPGSTAYLLTRAMRLRGPLNPSALEQSLNSLVARHESLRTTFATVDGTPIQVITPTVLLSLTVVDWQDLSPAQQERAIGQHVEEDASTPFDLAVSPLIRATLLKLGPEEHVFLLTLHHIITDGWSMGLLFRELSACYQAACDGQPAELPPLPIQYADYSAWQRKWLHGKVLEQQLAYWRDQLSDLTLLDFPTDHPRPPMVTHHGQRHTFTLSSTLLQGIKAVSSQAGTTLFMTLLAAFQVLLARYSGQQDIAVGTPIAGRSHTDLEDLIGFFVNTLILRTQIRGQPTFHEVLRQVRKTCLKAYRHQDLPFEKLVEVLQPVRDPSRHPLFQVMFQVNPRAANTEGLPGLACIPITRDQIEAKFDLAVALTESLEGLRGTIDFNTDLFEVKTMAQLSTHFKQLLEAIAQNPDQRVGELSLLEGPECRQLLVEWNATGTSYPRETTLAERFEAQVVATPDAVALVFDEQQLTYFELNTRANYLAHHLHQQYGVGPEVCVGLCMQRSVEMIVGLLGILKAGGAYVPLDPRTPPERLAFMVKDADLALVLTQDALKVHLSIEWAGPVIQLDTDWGTIAQTPATNVTSGVMADNLAYIMYTSGSTGVPKGTSIFQRNVVRLVMNTNYLEYGPEETFLQFAPLAFDASTFELWGSLLHGGKLVIFPPHQPSFEELGHCLQEQGISTLWLTAAMFHQMVDNQLLALREVRQLLAGGDVLSVPHVQKVVENLSEGGRLINGYGPTENTTFTCCHTMTRESLVETTVPIGRPIANTQVYVLDGAMQPVSVGVYGELYIGGDGLARNYIHRTALTAERFVPHPFSEGSGSRLYKTGDIVRYRSDGSLEFKGRRDHQVKLRGYRIELGEIEAVLAQHPGVQDSVALVREDAPGEKRVVGYVVIAQEEGPSVNELRRFLQKKLPNFMIPTVFVILDALPLTPTGKMDQQALPVPDGSRRDLETGFVAPQTATEEQLAEIWRDVLGIELVGVHDNFFDLGGHSLLATQVVSRVQNELKSKVSIGTFFEAPTIAQFAEAMHSTYEPTATLPMFALPPRSQATPIPLSFAQQRFWFLEQVEQSEGVFCIPVQLRLKGNLDIAALERSFQTLIRRHEILRTSFPDREGTPIQVIAPDRNYMLQIIDVTGQTEHERLDALSQLVDESVLQPFDLRQGPLMKTALFRIQESEYVLLVAFHHIASDGWSMGIFNQELVAAYDGYSNCREPQLPPLPFQYADYTLWQREWLQGERLDELLTYWRRQLAGAPTVLNLPTDRSRFLAQTFRGASERINLPASLTKSLKTLARREESTLFMVLLAAFKVLLARYSRCFDIVVGTPIANRPHPDLEKLIGFFANTLAIRTDLSQNPSFRTLLGRVRKGCLEAYRHQNLPFEKLVEDLRPERDSLRHPLVQVLFAFQNAPSRSWELAGLQVDSLPLGSQKIAFDVSFSLREQDERLQGSITYKIDLFDKETISRMLGHFQSLLESIVKNPDQPICALPLLTEQEHHDLVRFVDAEPSMGRKDFCIHEYFEKQVLKNPDKIAVLCEDQHVTYQQLNGQANQLAQYLRLSGIEPDMKVALFLKQSINLVVGMLGILKAGGSYVPLDPAFPHERLVFMIKDASIELMLTEKDLLEEASKYQIRHICIDPDNNVISTQRSENSKTEVTADNLAYIIFTSGSTGQPKGVGVTHDNVVRLFERTQPWFQFSEHDTWTFFHSPAFDFSVWELFGALLNGGKVVIVPHWVRRAPDLFHELVVHEQVTILNQTPSAFQEFIRAEETLQMRSDLALRLIVFGGEALDFQNLKPWVERHGDQAPRLINMYGITETTVHVTCRPLTFIEFGFDATSKIGNPIPDLRVYILDQYQQPVPIGVPGEMYIAGAGITRGYVNHPDLTGARYIPNPYSLQAGARLYRSGDLGRYLSNGDIEYWGRVDHQVKIRGFRIELGEIKTRLVQHPEVHEAVVVVREDQLEDKRIVAYLIVGDSTTSLIPDLRTYLSKWLPNYMIPSAFVMLSSLPLNSNGKIDFEKLPPPEVSRESLAQPFEQARTPVEEKLVNIWREVLNVTQVGIRDNFFDLGGHSLLLTKLANRVHDTFQIRVPLRVMFDLPTIERLGQAIVEEQVMGADKVTVNHLLSKLNEMTPEQVSALLKGQ